MAVSAMIVNGEQYVAHISCTPVDDRYHETLLNYNMTLVYGIVFEPVVFCVVTPDADRLGRRGVRECIHRNELQYTQQKDNKRRNHRMRVRTANI